MLTSLLVVCSRVMLLCFIGSIAHKFGQKLKWSEEFVLSIHKVSINGLNANESEAKLADKKHCKDILLLQYAMPLHLTVSDKCIKLAICRLGSSWGLPLN